MNALHPTLLRLIAFIPQTGDDDRAERLLDLFDVESEDLIPIEHLVTKLALHVNGDKYWLASDAYGDTRITLFKLLQKDPRRIPVAPIHSALMASLFTTEAPSIEYLSELALLIPADIAPFPEDALTLMKAYALYAVRLAVVPILLAYHRDAELLAYIQEEVDGFAVDLFTDRMDEYIAEIDKEAQV